MYDLGILGGMGSEATDVLFRKILGDTDTQKDQDFPDIVILNKASIPDRSAFLLGKSSENPLNALTEGIQELNRLPVSRIALPCNTAHAFYKELQETSGCPVINMLEASLQYIDQSHPGAQVCILGTLGTVQTRTYEKYNHFSLTIIYPEETLCEEVHALIYDIKKNILPSVDDFVRRLSHIMNQVAGNDSNIVFLLACTELSVLGAENFPEYTVLDALDILSLVSVAASTKKLKIRAPYDEKIISEIAQNYK